MNSQNEEGWGAWPLGAVAFLYTDLKNSTPQVIDLGDLVYAEAIKDPHYRVLFEALKLNGGRLISDKGDGIIGVFGSVSEAFAAALQIQKETADERILNPKTGKPIGVRIGIHLSQRDAILLPGHQAGDRPVYSIEALSYASRVEASAEDGQIALSASAYRSLNAQISRDYPLFKSLAEWESAKPKTSIVEWADRDLKGVPDADALYEVVYEGRKPKELGKLFAPPWMKRELGLFIGRQE